MKARHLARTPIQVEGATGDQINTLRVVRGVSRGHRIHRGIASANIVVDPTQQNPALRMASNAIDVRAGITLR